KKTENKFALLKQLILLPLLAVLVMGLAEREVRTEFINPDKKDEFHVTHPGKYTIADIEISGIQNPDRTALIQLYGLELGETIEIPGKDINNAVKKLWQQELFSDVKITASKIVGDDIWIDIFLQEQNKKDEFHVTHPGKYTIADIEISGIQNPDRTALIQLSGLDVGETIEIPGEAINNAVK